MAEVSKADLEKEIESWRVPKLYMMNWNERNTLTLIQLIKERQLLWDATLEDHKNDSKKLDAVIEVANILKITKEEVILKWMSLMDEYYRAIRKEKKVKPAKWFEKIASLFSSNKPHQSTSGAVASNKHHQPKSGTVAGNKPHQSTSGAVPSNKPHQFTSGAVASNKPHQSTSGAVARTKPHQSTSGAVASNKPHQSTSDAVASNEPHQSTSGAVASNEPQQPKSGVVASNKDRQPTSGAVARNKPHQPTSGAVASNKPHQLTSGAVASNKPHQPASDNNMTSSSQIILSYVLPLQAVQIQQVGLPKTSAAIPEPRFSYRLLTLPSPVLPQPTSFPISSTNTPSQQSNPTDTLAPAMTILQTILTQLPKEPLPVTLQEASPPISSTNILAQQSGPTVTAIDTLAPVMTKPQTMPTLRPKLPLPVTLQQASPPISSTNILAQQSGPTVTAIDTLAPVMTKPQTMPTTLPKLPLPVTLQQASPPTSSRNILDQPSVSTVTATNTLVPLITGPQTTPTPLPNVSHLKRKITRSLRSQSNQLKRKQHFDLDKEDIKKTVPIDKIDIYARYISNEMHQLSPSSQTKVKLEIQKLISKYALKDFKDRSRQTSSTSGKRSKNLPSKKGNTKCKK